MRAGLERRFLDEVDPDRELPEAERLRRVECAKRAYYRLFAVDRGALPGQWVHAARRTALVSRIRAW